MKKLFRRAKPYSIEICIFFVFVLLSVVVTYPLVFRMSTGLYGGFIKAGYFSNDAKGGLYCLWWVKCVWQHHFMPKFMSYICSPFGVNLIQGPAEPGLHFPTFVLLTLTNEIFSHNFFVVLSFPLSAVMMYCLAYYLTKNKLGSSISGVIYAFSSYHILQSYCHLGLAMIQWIPLYILFLFRFDERRTYRSALWCALTFALVTLSAYYYGYFMLIFTIAFLLFKLVFEYITQRRSSILDYPTLKLSVFTILVAFLLIVPFLLNIFIFGHPRFAPQLRAYVLSNLAFFGTRWWSYLLPSFENPIFGRSVENFLYSQLSGNVAEQILYLGYVPLALAALALFVWKKRRKEAWDRSKESPFDGRADFAIPFFIFAGLVGVVWSAPPYITLASLEIPMPSSFMHGIVPVFGSYGRFGILTILSLGVLTAFGLKYLLENVSSLRKQVLVTCLVGALILIEIINIPPFKTVDVSASTTPKVYGWLSSQSGDFSIAEYPFLAKSDPRQYDYLFYQRVHEKKMVNAINSDDEVINRASSYLGNVADPNVPPILSYLGVKYVIVHTDLYRGNEGGIPRIRSGQGLVFVKSFPGALVYEVKAKPQKILWLRYKNFYSSETWEDGREWNWASSSEAEVVAVNYTGRELPCDIRFLAASLGKSRNLRALLNGKEIKKVIVAPVPDVTEVILRDVKLQSGENSIMLYADLPVEKIDAYLHNGDVREATFAVSDFGTGN